MAFYDRVQELRDLRDTRDFSKFLAPTDSLSQLALEGSYHLHSSYGSDPKVIILGTTHISGGIDQQSDLAELLPQVMKPGDVLLYENSDMQGIYEVDFKGYHRNDLIGFLKPFFVSNNIRILMNDDSRLRGDFMKSLSDLEQCVDGTPEQEQAAKQFLSSLYARDVSFCFQKSVGIVPLVQGKAKIYSQISPTATIYQIVGLDHINTNIITEALEKFDISYRTYIPEKKNHAVSGSTNS